MASNPYKNKIIYDGDVLMDLSSDTVTPENLTEGFTAHDRSGAPIVGTAPRAAMEEITWAALKEKRDAGTLDKGRQYRITDYICTTTELESRAVSHPFDVIVFADDESTLNENARACTRDGDTYYVPQLEHAVAYDGTVEVGAAEEGYPFVQIILSPNNWPVNGGAPATPDSITVTYDGTVYTPPRSTDQRGNPIYGEADASGPVFTTYPFMVAVIPGNPGVLLVPTTAAGMTHTLKIEFDYMSGANAKLEAWELKYCIDNDTDRFSWVDPTNGKGVIYYMKDDYNNECPYDFKQIQFARYEVTNDENGRLTGAFVPLAYDAPLTVSETPTWFYTFSTADSGADEPYKDASLTGQAIGNVIKPSYRLPENVFIGQSEYNVLGEQSYRNTFQGQSKDNELGSTAANNVFYGDCGSNTFGDDCNGNTFGGNCYSNTFGDYCTYNTFGYACGYNTFGYACTSNTFGDSCTSNMFGNYCGLNTFGDNCNGNTFGYACNSNTFRDNCYSNTFGDGCGYNTFGYACGYNTFGDYCTSNTFGGSCSSNTFGNYCGSNTFGDGCYSNTFGNNCNYIEFAVGISGTKQYYHILDGVAGTSSTPLAITATAGNTYETYVGKNSNGVLKTWVPADLADIIDGNNLSYGSTDNTTPLTGVGQAEYAKI